MTSNIWVPSGNIYQTKIDQKIGEALFWINQTENDLQYHKLQLHNYKRKLQEIDKALSFIKQERGVTISMREYNEMIRDKNNYLKTIDEFSEMINTCQKFITMQRRAIQQLEVQRDKLETKIIRFKVDDGQR